MIVQEAYCTGRKRLADELQAELAAYPHLLEVLRRTLWSPAWCGGDGVPDFFFPSRKWRHRFEVIGFDCRPLGVEAVAGGQFLRAQTTSNWHLALAGYADGDAYLHQLSKKNQKKLRWLQNVYEREKIQFVPIKTREQLEEFMSVYVTQWPETNWATELKETLFAVYLYFEKAGVNRSFLVKDADGRTVAGSLGYLTDHGFNLHMLTRKDGMLDKYSPGYYLTYWLVRRVLNEERTEAFFFGPGAFEYKKSFMAQELPIYRYERRTWTNMLSILRLYNRCRKERRRQEAVDAERPA